MSNLRRDSLKITEYGQKQPSSSEGEDNLSVNSQLELKSQFSCAEVEIEALKKHIKQ